MAPDTLKLAKQGNPVAIAAMINQWFDHKGITARATSHNHHLTVFLEYQTVLEQDLLIDLLKNSFADLKPANISRVTVRGSAAGHMTDAWQGSFTLTAPSKTTPSKTAREYLPIATNAASPLQKFTQDSHDPNFSNSNFSNNAAIVRSGILETTSARNQYDILGLGVLVLVLIVNLGFLFDLSGWSFNQVAGEIRSNCVLSK